MSISLRQETTVADRALHVIPAISPQICSQIYRFLLLPSSSISSFTTSSTIPVLTADGVLIKSSRNRTVSKQCSTCQLSNCWALLQPLCLAREGRMRGREDKINPEWGRHIAKGQIRGEKIKAWGKTRKGKSKRWSGKRGYGKGRLHAHIST